MKKLLWISIMALGGCAAVSPTSPAPVTSLHTTKIARVNRIPSTPKLAPSEACVAVRGQAQAYLRATIALDKDRADRCLKKGSGCWDTLANLLQSQADGLSTLAADQCAESRTLVRLGRSYLRESSRVARSCALVGIPQCFHGAAAAQAKTLRAELRSVVGGHQ